VGPSRTDGYGGAHQSEQKGVDQQSKRNQAENFVYPKNTAPVQQQMVNEPPQHSNAYEILEERSHPTSATQELTETKSKKKKKKGEMAERAQAAQESKDTGNKGKRKPEEEFDIIICQEPTADMREVAADLATMST